MALSQLNVADPIERKRRIRRSTFWLSLIALAFYLGFIAMSVKLAHG